MKRILTFILFLTLCCCFGVMLVACNTQANDNPPITGGETETPALPSESPDEDMPKVDITEPTPNERQTIYLWDDDKIPAWRGSLNSNDPARLRRGQRKLKLDTAFQHVSNKHFCK